ncbi:hypothetical protein ONS95_012134 [Cadophora gregata]|uniref:uncharacterized protein n=1 Tax=Cadophora gregata TaxID=51156 RepID=UPI0026DB58C3|nr:uncharacterized protein ONS95_012134 [Cadophora gregata]KAK0117810.1 hypothetical protein ONS95_012134 [Cadophora gregata]KAK0122863.1 hypothetical protein ONS96_009890 [Cadophora gregata f. sp. sojae]
MAPPTLLALLFEKASNVDIELNKRSLSLAGSDLAKLIRLRCGIRGEKGREVSKTGEVKYKKEFKLFPKLPLELRRMIWWVFKDTRVART